MIISPDSKEFFSILDKISDPVTILSPDFIFIWANNAYAQHMRIKKENILSMSLEDIIPNDYAPVLKGKYRKIDQSNPTFENIYPSALPDGSIILEKWHNEGVFNEDGSLKYYYCIANLKEEMIPLTQHQTDLVSSTLIRSALLGIIIAIEHIIVYINSKAWDILGVEETPYEGLNLTEFIDGIFKNRAKTLLTSDSENRISSSEMSYPHPDGHDCWLSIIRKAQRYNNKNADLFIIEDISERKLNEIETERAKNTLANVMRIAKVGYWEKDFINDRWIWSDETYDIYNIPRGTLMTEQIINDAIDQAFQKTRDQRIITILNEKDELSSYKFEYKIHPWGEEAKWIAGETFTKSIDEYGNIQFYGWVQDITDRKLIEKELIEAKEKAEESEHLKTVFLANMSHEIRTPLNAILGFSDLLTQNPSPVEQKKFKEIINQSSRLLLKIIDDILDFSSIESGSPDFSSEPVLLTEVFEEMKHIYFDHDYPDISLKIESPEPGLLVYADRERVKQVLINLINNAFKYTKRGSINLSCSKKDGDDMVCFSVKDTGLGIPIKEQSRIFKRFYQADSFSKGTGLGLTLSRSIIEQMGGSISVESQPGEGSEFIFSLPAYK